jgi:hypothetical protein
MLYNPFRGKYLMPSPASDTVELCGINFQLVQSADKSKSCPTFAALPDWEKRMQTNTSANNALLTSRLAIVETMQKSLQAMLKELPRKRSGKTNPESARLAPLVENALWQQAHVGLGKLERGVHQADQSGTETDAALEQAEADVQKWVNDMLVARQKLVEAIRNSV